MPTAVLGAADYVLTIQFDNASDKNPPIKITLFINKLFTFKRYIHTPIMQPPHTCFFSAAHCNNIFMNFVIKIKFNL